jgi:hypothetical protein
MCRTAKKLYLLAPIWYPTIGFLVCLITLSLATEMREIGGNAALTFRFGARGLFQLTIIAGAAVAFVGWFFQKRRKTLLALEARPKTPFVARLERWCHMRGMTRSRKPQV